MSLYFALYNAVTSFIDEAREDDRGVTAIEYALIAFLVAVTIIAAVTLLGTRLRTIFETINTSLT